MPYYPDLSDYGDSKYSDYLKQLGQKPLHVGWLDGRHHFEKARPSKWLVERLWAYCEYSSIECHGYHDCNIADCPGPAKKFNRIHAAERAKRLCDLKKKRAFLLKALEATFSGKGIAFFKHNVAPIDQEIMNAERGYSRMIVGIHPVTHKRMELGYAEIRVFGKGGKLYEAPNMLYHYVTVHHYKPPDEFLQALKNAPAPPSSEYLSRLEALGLTLSLVQSFRRSQQDKKLKKNLVGQKSV